MTDKPTDTPERRALRRLADLYPAQYAVLLDQEKTR